MTRTVGYLALACVIIVGAAVVGFVVARDDALVLPAETTDAPAANRDAKTDRLQVAAAVPPLEDRLRQADALQSRFADPQMDGLGPSVAPVENPPLPVSRPKAADLPPVQISYTLLSDIQIAAIKERLRMSEAQAKYWPPVEAALRALARKMHETRTAGSARGTIALTDGDAEQLQTAAAPLLRQLREDQKREVRALARIIGLDVVASRI
ncbi:hypothetical protein ACWX0K_04320 [Nitrobacteraceae bacterium UC4446_H13]